MKLRSNVAVLALLSVFLALPAFGQGVEGFGAVATGGQGGQVCTVTNTAATGAGSFSDCARRGNVVVQFNGPGPFRVDGQQTYIGSNTTIDGCANGQNGVTLDQPADIYRAVVCEGGGGCNGNVIVRCIRFQGTAKAANGANTEHDLLAFDATEGPISRVLVDRCTFNQATDGALDLTGDVSDVTVQRSLFYRNPMTQLIKYDNGGKFPRNLSIHHNVYTQNAERNPQMRGAIFADFVSNVVGPSARIVDAENGQPYSQYGTFLWNSNTTGEGKGNVSINVTNSAFVGVFDSGPNQCSGAFGITICTDTGASAAGIFLADNLCSSGSCPNTIRPTANPIPTAALVTMTPVSGLKGYLPNVGSPNKTAEDKAALDAVAARLPGPGPSPTPTPVPTPGPTPTPSPSPSPSPTPCPQPTPCPICPPPATCPPPVLNTTCNSAISDANLSNGKKRRRTVTTCDTVY